MGLLCPDVVVASCLLLLEKNNETPHDVTYDLMPEMDWDGVTH